MSNELIRKTDVLDLLNELYSYFEDYEAYSILFDDIDNMKPANAVEQKTGHWINYYGEVEIYNAGGFTETRKIGVKCSVCQWINRWYAGNYCGNCGAKMEVEET